MSAAKRGAAPDPVGGPGGPAVGPNSEPDIDPEAAILGAMTAELERIALEPGPKPSAGFADRVGAVIAREPAPVPMAAAGSAVRHHSAPGIAAALRDSARVGFGRHRPATARVGAFAMLAVAALIVVSVGGALAFGAASVFVPVPRETHRSEQASQPAAQSPATISSEPTNPTTADEPSSGPTSSPLDNDGPGASRATADPDATLKPGQTPKPSESPLDSDGPTESPSPRPSATPHGGDGGQ